MVDDVFKLALSLQVMKEQRQKMVSDFTETFDYDMFKGLYRYDNQAEYSLYAELYHVTWIDEHWNIIQKIIDDKISLESDKRYMEIYFSECFLKFIEEFSMTNNIYTPAFYNIMRVKKATLKDMIAISDKHNKNRYELLHAIDKHKVEYREKIMKLKNKE